METRSVCHLHEKHGWIGWEFSRSNGTVSGVTDDTLKLINFGRI